jgi:hypothetical protein
MKYLAVAIPAVLIYPLGIPLSLTIAIYRRRYKLADWAVRQSLGFVYEAYCLDSWWLEMGDMLHKLFLTSLLRFIPQAAQLPTAMCVVALFTIVILLRQPYLRRRDDTLHLFGQVELFLLLLAAYILQKEYATGLDPTTDLLLSIVLVGVICLLFCLFFLYLILVFRRLIYWHQRRILKHFMAREDKSEDELEVGGSRSSLVLPQNINDNQLNGSRNSVPDDSPAMELDTQVGVFGRHNYNDS